MIIIYYHLLQETTTNTMSEIVSKLSLENHISKLPYELLYIIIGFDGRFKLRNGVWIYQIDKNDFRYNLVSKIRSLYRNVYIPNTQWEIILELADQKQFRINQLKFDPNDENKWDIPENIQHTNYLLKNDSYAMSQPIFYTYYSVEKIEYYTKSGILTYMIRSLKNEYIRS